jgi:hypothetical protein
MNAPDMSQAVWRKSSRSLGTQPDCVEVAVGPRVVAVRDSKNTGPVLAFPAAGWAAFVRR